MNIFEFCIPASWLLFLLWLVCMIFHSKNDKKCYVIFMWIFGVWLFGILSWATYQRNYVFGGYSNIAKITLYTCTKDNKTIEQDCEYIGAITYRPYMRELMITATPLYPILNCPSPNNGCVQEQIFVDKGNVKSLEKL